VHHCLMFGYAFTEAREGLCVLTTMFHDDVASRMVSFFEVLGFTFW